VNRPRPTFDKSVGWIVTQSTEIIIIGLLYLTRKLATPLTLSLIVIDTVYTYNITGGYPRWLRCEPPCQLFSRTTTWLLTMMLRKLTSVLFGWLKMH